MKKNKQNSNFTVLITGASRGIGLEFARQYLIDNCNVIACCRDPKQAHNLKALEKNHPNLKILKLDVCDPKNILALKAEIDATAIDVLINNAGILGQKFHKVGTAANKDLLNVFTTNVLGPLNISQALLANVVKSNFKTIIAISSLMGSIKENTSGDYYYAYRTSKAALNMAMKNFSIAVSQEKVRVMVLHPGWVKTDMGGSNAPVDVATSVAGLRAVIADPAHYHSGKFYSYQGVEIPW